MKAANGPAGSGLPLNVWSHLAATFDDTTLRLYVNGTQVASLATAGPIATSTGAYGSAATTSGASTSAADRRGACLQPCAEPGEIQADMNRRVPRRRSDGHRLHDAGERRTGFGVGSAVTAKFSEAMDAATIKTTTFKLRGGSNARACDGLLRRGYADGDAHSQLRAGVRNAYRRLSRAAPPTRV